MKSSSQIASIALCALAAGCVSHIAPYRAKERDYRAGEYAALPPPSPGSIFASGSRGLLEDERATRIGDIVIIQIDETDSASHDSTTKMSKKSAYNIGMSGGGAMPMGNMGNDADDDDNDADDDADADADADGWRCHGGDARCADHGAAG